MRNKQDRSAGCNVLHPYKLTKDEALEIYESKGIKTNKQAAAQYGVCRTTVESIRNGRTWSNVTGQVYVRKSEAKNGI